MVDVNNQITITIIHNTMDKSTQAKQLAKIRGHKVLTNHQILTMQQLSQLPSLSVVDIVNELESAPEAKLKESVKSARNFLSSAINRVGNAVRANEQSQS